MSTSNVIDQITEALSPLLAENEELRESIDEVRMMFSAEDRGWSAITGFNSGEKTQGLDLDEVKAVSEKARVKVAASSLPKRAADLHAGYVFGNGVEIDGTIRKGGKGAPKGSVLFYENPINQESLFSGAAKRELQYARFTDGNVLAFCDTAKKVVRRVPIHEITDVLVNPEFPDEIWGWLREWSQNAPDGKSTTRKAWAYSNRFTGVRQKSIKVGNETISVLRNVTVVDLRCNRQVGWTFGVPDAVAGLMWAEAYGKVMTYGQTVSEGLAKIIYKVTNTKTKAGAANVGVKMGSGGHGQGVALGEGQDIQLVNATQRSFDFTAARPLAAMAASAWNVSNIDLLADSSAAGSSYGAAQSLTPGMQNHMQGMRDEWTQFLQDVFQVMDFGRVGVHWPPMNEPDSYRMAQELTLYSVALTDEEYRAAVLDRLDIPGDPKDITEFLKSRGQVQRQAASPDQGSANGTGGQDSAALNDQRSDTIGETLKQMQQEDILDQMRSLVERMESVKG